MLLFVVILFMAVLTYDKTVLLNCILSKVKEIYVLYAAFWQ